MQTTREECLEIINDPSAPAWDLKVARDILAAYKMVEDVEALKDFSDERADGEEYGPIFRTVHRVNRQKLRIILRDAKGQ